MSEFRLRETAIPVGLSVIEASAGTGKTWTLAHLLPRLIIQGRIEKLDQALMVSFTEDSTRELAERARECIDKLARLLLDQDAKPSAVEDLEGLIQRAIKATPQAEPGLKDLLGLLLEQKPEHRAQRVRLLLKAQHDSDRLMVSTIHSLCRRVLSDQGFLCGMPAGFEVLPDVADLRAQAMRDAWRSELVSNPLLAIVAAREGWDLEDDARAWGLLEPLDGERLYPRPLSLDAAIKRVSEALQGIKENAGDFHMLVEIQKAPKAKGLNVKGKNEIFKNWKEALEALHWAWRGHAMRVATERFHKNLGRHNALSFNDLISRLHGALLGPSGEELGRRLRERWKVALIDESQDTDPRQMAIFEAIFNQPLNLEQSLVLIGDPKQAIYSFRGADLRSYEKARDREPKVPLSRLTQTYRSAKGLVDALNALWKIDNPMGSRNLELPEATAAKSDEELALPVGEKARLAFALVGEEGAGLWGRAPGRLRLASTAAAAAISELLAKKAVKPGDCAVLCRSNAQSKAVREALLALGIPAVLRDDGDVLESDEAADLAAVLNAALKPTSQAWRHRAQATRLLGMSSADLLALSDADEDAWQFRLSAWAEAWRRYGVAAFLSAMENDVGVSRMLASDPLGERRLTDFRHLGEWLQAEEAESRLAPERLLQRLQSAIAESAEGQPASARLQRLEQDGSAVQILTVHRAKGLEFDYVFCPFLWHARKMQENDERVARVGETRALLAPGMLELPERSALSDASNWERLEEDLRLAYVALTRARRRCWILAGWIGYADGNSRIPPSALDWILREPSSESSRDWYERVMIQKKALTKLEREKGRAIAFKCEHEARIRVLSADPHIRVEAVSVEGKPWVDPEKAGGELAASSAAGIRVPAWRVSSFSGMIRGHEQARDRDGYLKVQVFQAAKGEAVLLAPFAKGAQAGECLHALLELWDFNFSPDELIKSTLEKHGLSKGAGLIQSALPILAKSILPGLGALEKAAADPGLSEWHFLLPISDAGLSGERLAQVFAGHADARMRDYGKTLSGLSAEALRGMLQGFIDRIARVDGKWSLIDWKSNHLGGFAADYGDEALWRCAADSHYVLQAHLYLVALRRYIRLRAPCERLVGADLAFLRGMEAGSSRGILHFEADEAFLAAFDSLFAGDADA